MAAGYRSLIGRHLGGAASAVATGYRSQALRHYGGVTSVPVAPPPDPLARNKRAMMIGLDASYRLILPIPDGSIPVADRYQLAAKYHITGVPPVSLIFRNRTAARMRPYALPC